MMIGNVASNPLAMPMNASTNETYDDSEDISELSLFVPDLKESILISTFLIYLIWKLKSSSNSFYFRWNDPDYNLQSANTTVHEEPYLNPETVMDQESVFGNWTAVENLIKGGVTPSTKVLCRAYAADKSEIVSYILNRMEELNFEPYLGLILATKSCRGLIHLMITQNHIRHVDGKLLNLSCRYGHLSLVKYILKVKRLQISKAHLELAILSGNTQLVSFFVDKFKMTPGADALDIACYSRNLNLLRYLEEQFGEILAVPSLQAVIFDSQVLKYFVQEKSYPITNYMFKQTAMHGYFDSFAFLENNYPFHADIGILDAACFSGNLSFVKYLVEERDMEPNIFNLDSAVINNQLNVVKYLINERNITHDHFVEKMANEGRSTKLIQFLKTKTRMIYNDLYLLDFYWFRRLFHSSVLKRQSISSDKIKAQLKRLVIT